MVRRCTRLQRARWRVRAAAVEAAMMRLLLLALVACTRGPMPTVPVAVISWPSPIKPQCELVDLPEPPKLPVWTTGESEFSRLYVRAADVADIRSWLVDMQRWTKLTNACLQKLTGPVK